jgi:hypothetical protein
MTGYMDFVTSSGGPSTKIHALVDALGNPLAFLLTPGQAHDLVGAVSIENRLDESPIVLGGCAGITNFPRKQVLDSLRATPSGAARVRPGTLQGAPPNRKFLLQTQTVPRHSHTLRQDCERFPRRHPSRSRYGPAQPTIHPSKKWD